MLKKRKRKKRKKKKRKRNPNMCNLGIGELNLLDETKGIGTRS